MLNAIRTCTMPYSTNNASGVRLVGHPVMPKENLGRRRPSGPCSSTPLWKLVHLDLAVLLLNCRHGDALGPLDGQTQGTGPDTL